MLLLPRFEASGHGRPAVGLGHVARTVALGSAWVRTGGECTLVAVGLPTVWRDRCEAVGIVVSDRASGHADWVVIDDYGASLTVQAKARETLLDGAANGLLVIDDHGSLGEYGADVVLDQNVAATADRYRSRPSDSRLLLGPAYTLLRDEFRRPPSPGRDRRSTPTTVLISAGGQPSDELRDRMRDLEGWLVKRGCTVTQLSGADDVAGAMASADVAVAASGSTAYELCRMGVPTVMFAVADNQVPVGQELARRGAAEFVGPLTVGSDGALRSAVDALIASPGRREAMSCAAAEVVDGRGADRVVADLRADALELVPLDPSHREQVWEWANEAETRRQSFDPTPIPWDDHVRWFEGQLTRDDRRHYVARLDGVAVGQIRFDLDDQVATIGYGLDVAARGRGWGAPLLVAGARRLVADRPGTTSIVGLVKPENIASARAFDLAGYAAVATDRSDAVAFALTPEES